VSDDEADLGVASIPVTSKKKSSSTSSRDDTVGHFRGGTGTIIADRYKIVRDVGLGTFGRVVECLDVRRARKAGRGRGDSERVAIKIVRDVRRYYDSAVIEASIVEDVNRRGGRGISHCAIMHDAFTWNSHYCMVFESLGPSLYDFLKKHKYCGFPMICVRDFAKQLLEALEFLHSAGLIHTDLKPENILLVSHREVPYKWHGKTYRIPESTKVKVIDFGGATYDNEKKSSVVNTRQYRAPEVILSLGWSMPSDLWSAGCILAELYLGELLFATHDNQEHLALIEKVIAPFPPRILDRAKKSQLVQEAFDDNGRHRLDRVLPPESASYVSKMRPLESIIRPEDRKFLDLLRMLLVINPDERATAQACVRHRL
jgi:serine/threonine protein kinase